MFMQHILAGVRLEKLRRKLDGGLLTLLLVLGTALYPNCEFLIFTI
jgi:hypothetical protein